MIERERERQRHRQREKQAPCREPDVGLDPGTPGSCPGLHVALNHCATGAALFCYVLMNKFWWEMSPYGLNAASKELFLGCRGGKHLLYRGGPHPG